MQGTILMARAYRSATV